MIRHSVRFTGCVQGVGFRWTTRRIAESHPGVTGWVRNEPDGSVRVVAEGNEASIGAFIEAIRVRMSENITDVVIDRLPATGEFSSFEIRR